MATISIPAQRSTDIEVVGALQYERTSVTSVSISSRRPESIVPQQGRCADCEQVCQEHSSTRSMPTRLADLEGYRDQDLDDPRLPPCSQMDPNLWDPSNRRELDIAKAVCMTCPLQESCYWLAKRSADETGVWGGAYFFNGQEMDGFTPRKRRVD